MESEEEDPDAKLCNGVDHLLLAIHGFFCTGQGQEVECGHCNIRIIWWIGIGDLLERHREAAPGCNAHVNYRASEVRGRLEEDHLPAPHGLPSASSLEERANTTQAFKPHSGSDSQLSDLEFKKLPTRIEPREVKARMNSTIVRAILEMGYSHDLIKTAIETKLLTTGDDFQNSEDLLEAIFELEGNMSTTSVPDPLRAREENRMLLYPTTDEPSRFPEFIDVSRRLSSFRSVTLDNRQTAERLADAGFFYDGPRDLVQCFQCGCNLENWEHGDDPWEEHRRRYDLCPYIQKHQSRVTTRAAEPSLPTTPINTDCRLESFRGETLDHAQAETISGSSGESTHISIELRPTDSEANIVQPEDQFARASDFSSLAKVHPSDLISYISPNNSSEIVHFNRREPDLRMLNAGGFRLRLLTFYDWDNRHGDRMNLASQGYFYSGQPGTVVCSHCNIRYRVTSFSTRPECLHSCPFAHNLDAHH